MDKKRLLKGILSVFLVLCLSGVGIVYAGRNDMTGATFRMEKTEGTVVIRDDKGSKVSMTEGMLLYSGDSVQTDAKSYAYINLDDSKLIKVDELSKTTLQKSGKKLELGVDEGAVYFEVSKKLADDESMVIGDSTISLSIRGTTGVFRKRRVGGAEHYTVMLLEGKATVSCMGAGTFQIWGGERVDYIPSTGGFNRTLIRVTDIPGFAAVEVRAKQDVASKVLASGIDLEWMVANADSKLAADQASNLSQFKDVFSDGDETQQQTSNLSEANDSQNVEQNTSGGSDGTSSGSGSGSSDDDTDTGDDSGESGDDATTVDTLTISGIDVEYIPVTGETYPVYLKYLDSEGKTVKVWLTKESSLYFSLEDNNVLDNFEIEITNFTETPDDEEYYGVGEIGSIKQITDAELTFTEMISADAFLKLNSTCTFTSFAGYQSASGGKLEAEDIILGDQDNRGILNINHGNSVQIKNIYSVNGAVYIYNSNNLTVSGQVINQGSLLLQVSKDASMSCETIVNDGTLSINNGDNAKNTCLSDVTLTNNNILQIESGIHLKRLENTSTGYFEHYDEYADNSYPIVVTDGLIISDLQKSADEVVYLSTDDTTAISGTFDGENELLYTTDNSGNPCFKLVTSDDSGESDSDSEETGADSYTGQIVSYEGASITIVNDETSQNETIQLGTYSPMLDSLKSNGVLTEFKATIEKQESSGYKVMLAEQTTGDTITLDSEVTMQDESLKLIGNTEIANYFYLKGTSVLEAEVLDLVMVDQRAWIEAYDEAKISVNGINVSDGILQLDERAALYVTNAITIASGGTLDCTYSVDTTIGTFDIMINTSGKCWISCSTEGQNDVFRNVSILNLGELVIDDTTINSISNGDSATVENEGGNLTILNP